MSLTNQLNIGDQARVHRLGQAAGCIGDGEIVTVVSIQTYNGGILYSGEYQDSCWGLSGIQFNENEYEVVLHTNN